MALRFVLSLFASSLILTPLPAAAVFHFWDITEVTANKHFLVATPAFASQPGAAERDPSR